MNEALRDWVTNVADTYYLIGTAAGPHPYPEMVRDFQSVIGTEARAQMLEAEGRLPDVVMACVGGGSNAIGLFHAFLDDPDVRIVGVEAGGRGLDDPLGHAASLTGGRPGVLHGNRTYLLQDDDGQIIEGHSISAGLDYPGIGPEHAWLKDAGRVQYVPATDDEAMAAFQTLAKTEGILPALEPAHALAKTIEMAAEMDEDQNHRHESLRARRQGRAHGGRGAGDGALGGEVLLSTRVLANASSRDRRSVWRLAMLPGTTLRIRPRRDLPAAPYRKDGHRRKTFVSLLHTGATGRDDTSMAVAHATIAYLRSDHSILPAEDCAAVAKRARQRGDSVAGLQYAMLRHRPFIRSKCSDSMS